VLRTVMLFLPLLLSIKSVALGADLGGILSDLLYVLVEAEGRVGGLGGHLGDVLGVEARGRLVDLRALEGGDVEGLLVEFGLGDVLFEEPGGVELVVSSVELVVADGEPVGLEEVLGVEVFAAGLRV